mmetsp:Transcript_91927/g.165981  ORF Transcript_91927/g.165981 Transcript_91927/m.165981 type:complete len:422 (+) Transcript_91927:796-2061(+)
MHGEDLALEEFDLDRRGLDQATVQEIPCIHLEPPRKLQVPGRWNAKVGGACIHHTSAGPVLAHVQLLAVDAHGLDAHQPVAHVTHRHAREGRWLEDSPRVDAPEGDFALLSVLAVRQEHAELGLRSPARTHEHVKRTEVLVHRQAFQAEPQDAVEVEGLEGLRGHVNGRDHIHLHAHGAVVHHLVGRACILCGAAVRHFFVVGPGKAHTCDERCGLSTSGPGPLLNLSFFLIFRLHLAKANCVTNKFACDLAGTEADGHLLAELALVHEGAVCVDGHGAVRGGLIVAPPAWHQAGLGLALAGRQHDVPGAGVEDHPEVLGRRAEAEDPRIGGLEGGDLAAAVDGHGFPAQSDHVRLCVQGRCVRLAFIHQGNPGLLEQAGTVLGRLAESCAARGSIGLFGLFRAPCFPSIFGLAVCHQAGH